ncbi:MAG: hypothetical protein RML72_08560, partial [Bacteroidia bacterium]|nr:hypothetical protein [Bacteroidia bacterium]
MFLLILVSGGVAGFIAQKELITSIRKFQEIKSFIETQYVDSVSDSTLIHYALEGLLSHLDPYTWYIPQDQFQKISERLENSYVGVGIYT